MTNDEKQGVIDRLLAYKKQFDDLLALLDGIPLGREGTDRARQLLKGLKDGLRRDSDVEIPYFGSAVRQALAEIHVAWNGAPSGEWFSELYGAQINITHALHQLKS